MSNRSTAIARGVILQVLARVSAFPLSLVTLGIATRYLGQQGYGVLTTAVVFVGVFETLTGFGMGTVIVRRVAGRGGSLERLVGVNLTLSTVIAIPVAAIAAASGLVVYSGEPTTQLAVVVLAAGLIFTCLSNVFNPVFDVQVKYFAVAWAEFGSRILTLGAALAVSVYDWGLLAMVAVQIIPHLMRTVFSLWGARRLATIRWVLDRTLAWDLFKESIPITLISIIGVLYWRADGVVLSLLADEREVGAYGLALQIAFTLSLVSNVFQRTVLSTVNQTFNHDPERFRRAIDQGFRFLLLCSAPIAVLGWVIASRVSAVIGSEEFRESTGPVLSLFFVAVALTFLTAIMSAALIAAHEQRFLTTLSAINLAVNIGLNIALIPSLGAVATGIALLITETSGVVFALTRLRRHGVHGLPLTYLARLTPPLGVALLAMWATWSLPLAVPMIAGGLTYALGVLAVGAVPPSMRDALLGALRPRSLDRSDLRDEAGREGREGERPEPERTPDPRA